VTLKSKVGFAALRIEKFLADGRLRTFEEILDSVDGDDETIREALNRLHDEGRVSFTRAAGVGFWQRHPLP
jgi:hypothetical protein